MSLVACLGPMQEMGMNVKHPTTVTRPQTLRYLVFKFWEIQNSPEIHETWHAIIERHQHVVVNFLSHLGQVWGYDSHKPELLTTSLMVSVGNVSPFWTK